MPFIPHTDDDIKQMLDAIGAKSIETLFDEIPAALRCQESSKVPQGVTEMQLNTLIDEKAQRIHNGHCFLGAGAYEHHIPAAVWDIASRGEFLTAYTPYQAEASQGTLQLLYEFQTMISNLCGMDVSNASLYDGASALAEASLMAIRLNRKSKSRRILVPSNIHPHYFSTVQSIVSNQNIELVRLPYCQQSGTTLLDGLEQYNDEDITALIIQQPNFFGGLEDVDALTLWAKKKNAIVIGCVNPTSLALLKEPGAWGDDDGVDIVCGEGQPLGAPLASGGPYFGFMCTKLKHVRQLPGRLIGKTVDAQGKEGFALTLQAREQHIRRSKATSNICTNQGLLVTAATLYMSLLGADGLQAVAIKCHQNTTRLVEKLTQIDGVTVHYSSPYFHEACIRLPIKAGIVIEALLEKGILAGFDLGSFDAALDHCLLVCATETKSENDLDFFAQQLAALINA